MLEVLEKDKCSGCEACVNVCPQTCISMFQDQEGFMYPLVDTKHCINCGLCERVCPFKEYEKKTNVPIAVGAKAKDVDLRLASSSGGIFSILAENILQSGGVVFGAAMTEDCKSAQHIMVDSKDDLVKLRGSKYLQSRTGNTYKQARTMLEMGRKVLFSGTPCQIAGLKKYINKEYENLLTVEIICHGVASPALWQRYVEYLERSEGALLIDVNFRHKINGWKYYGLQGKLNDGRTISIRSNKNPYMQMYLRNYCVRCSCYDCKAKKGYADISLGDLWGIEDIAPEFNDDKGASLVLLYTEKGEKAFSNIKDSIESLKVDYQKALPYNPCIVKSVKRPNQRDDFFKDMEKMTFEKLQKKYLSEPMKNRIKRFVAKIVFCALRKH